MPSPPQQKSSFKSPEHFRRSRDRRCDLPDGSVAQETGFAVMGGSAEQIHRYVADHYTAEMSLPAALRLAVDAVGRDNGGGEPRQLTAESLEVAILDRDRPRRRFRRVTTAELHDLLA